MRRYRYASISYLQSTPSKTSHNPPQSLGILPKYRIGPVSATAPMDHFLQHLQIRVPSPLDNRTPFVLNFPSLYPFRYTPAPLSPPPL